MIELNDMIELSDKYWLTQNDDKQKENINQLIKIITKATLNGDALIYQPARQHCMFFYDVLNYCYCHNILSSKNDTVLDILDDLRLFTKKYNNPWTWYFNPITTPITFEEFMNNRSLSKYIQKASKEINYGNSKRNKDNNCKQ